MKKLLCMLLVLTISIFSSCNSIENNNSIEISIITYSTDNDNLKQVEPIEVQYSVMLPSYHHYKNAKELIKSADAVIVGKVTDISFELRDISTGLPPTEETLMGESWLTTIYVVDIITSYKGEVSDSIKIRIDGGIKDYRVEEQLSLIEEVKTHPEGGIPIQENMPNIIIGDTYLFAVAQSKTTTFYYNIIPQQSIYELSNPFKKHVLYNELYDSTEYYSGNQDEYGYPIISAKDVISHFGDDKWDEFWTQWQKDNTDWETRIDKAAVEQALAE